MLINLRNALMATSNKEEEMYKEMYLALIGGQPLPNDELVDNVSTTIRAYAIYQMPANIKKITLTAITNLPPNTLRGNTNVEEVDIPNVIMASSYTFHSDSKLKVIRAPNATTLGTQSLASCPSLTDVYMTNTAKASTKLFPFGCTNANTVFHFSDGDYDYQGNKLN